MIESKQSDTRSSSDADAMTLDELMRTSYEDYDIKGSPFVFPAIVRRWVSRFASLDYRIFAFVLWVLHRTWGFIGRRHSNPLAKVWSELAWQFTLRDGLRLGKAFAELDQHPTFRNGCAELNFRNSLDATFYRGSFLDPFFAQGPWEITETTHPLQQPQYFVAGIPSSRWYDPDEFEWKDFVEQSFPQAHEEVLQLLSDHCDQFGIFRTEIDGTVDGWNTFIFYANGRRQAKSCERAPRLADVADAMIAYEEGELTMLSSLNPRSYIPPHVGPINGILRCHLPLLVPDNCGLRVGGEEITWTEGKVLVFDDSFVHEVWNQSDQVRIVLFFNAWHPALSLPERQALANVRRAYNQTPAGRNWLHRNEEARTSTVVPSAG
ncbi:aspartyl/asparaginyl beta-hydroxylase domain-containing protein [Aporhodopirellula aestuarii]|uniref:Aspartyl/asparaginyl beta-hydroxylase domain-containing protein n=1 Tax=Aporhodopirellula aestuarii TaxID=2950107 RepID=A0ABT0TZZ7_9BACT|nr:aspartyl/asparaginyl beta-hydroxylase domain-containing protein [Aporhodopirellula aestuarii]MCM2370145.1 aspartyl/asparaginyl beta-hydroxylase domain-containing protein [Aporhodopirellula aestuarii]